MDSGYGALFAGGANLLGIGLQNYFNTQAAQKQMEFQERMSSTAYQRAMLDMEQAGLNPILAYSQGGASAPSGASAQHQNLLGGVVSSAMDYKRNLAELKKIESDVDLTKALTLAAEQDAQVKANTAKSIEYDLPGKQAEASIETQIPEVSRVMRLIQRLNPLRVFMR